MPPFQFAVVIFILSSSFNLALTTPQESYENTSEISKTSHFGFICCSFLIAQALLINIAILYYSLFCEDSFWIAWQKRIVTIYVCQLILGLISLVVAMHVATEGQWIINLFNYLFIMVNFVIYPKGLIIICVFIVLKYGGQSMGNPFSSLVAAIKAIFQMFRRGQGQAQGPGVEMNYWQILWGITQIILTVGGICFLIYYIHMKTDGAWIEFLLNLPNLVPTINLTWADCKEPIIGLVTGASVAAVTSAVTIYSFKMRQE